ncbi:WhiB family transcriptional regulator [Nakamurella flavida]|uniref:Transcriptional regulator WhiB n=1 Tax=Nakamurella flavida TaxID=363630 RepID=A0A938YLZ7_9ACTN|nr:WhiB family transcriptional regulator [Nakamurella flavida]MBM9477153.1 WhiB family transcriptional regulator [Nakamurella flavida]
MHLLEQELTRETDARSDSRPVTNPAVPVGPASAGPIVTPDPLDLPCHTGPDLFFAERPADLELAKSLCAACPMRAACLAGALERAEPWGVWGGEIFDGGVVIARKRPRGRPRKAAA